MMSVCAFIVSAFALTDFILLYKVLRFKYVCIAREKDS